MSRMSAYASSACGGSFPTRAVIDGKPRVLNSRKFFLECSPFGAHNTASIPIGPAPPSERAEARRRKRNAKTYRSLKRRRVRRKAELVAARGNRCMDCGYDGCLAAFEFHRRDPAIKGFTLSTFSGSLERLLTKAQKCDLLCASCHRLRHVALELPSGDPVVLHRRRRKLRAFAHMGSKCAGCGRDGPAALFEFHHRDAAKKDFGLSESGIPHRWEKVVAELEKCVMLCANCHREVHAGVRELDDDHLLGLAEGAGEYRVAA